MNSVEIIMSENLVSYLPLLLGIKAILEAGQFLRHFLFLTTDNFEEHWSGGNLIFRAQIIILVWIWLNLIIFLSLVI